MALIKLLTGILFIVLAQGCATTKKSATLAETKVFIDEDNNLNYIGALTSVANETIENLYDNSTKKPSTLLISSNGGEVRLGLDLGEWVYDKQMDIEVVQACMSSCANYIFPAAKEKRLRKDSVLGWHGSAWQKQFDKYSDVSNPEFSEQSKEQRKRETLFYEQIKVDNLMPIYGQDKLTWLDVIRYYFGKGVVAFDYSLSDLNKMGLTNIKLVDDNWNWRKYRKDQAYLIKRVELDNNYKFKLKRYEI